MNAQGDGQAPGKPNAAFTRLVGRRPEAPLGQGPSGNLRERRGLEPTGKVAERSLRECRITIALLQLPVLVRRYARPGDVRRLKFGLRTHQVRADSPQRGGLRR